MRAVLGAGFDEEGRVEALAAQPAVMVAEADDYCVDLAVVDRGLQFAQRKHSAGGSARWPSIMSLIPAPKVAFVRAPPGIRTQNLLIGTGADRRSAAWC